MPEAEDGPRPDSVYYENPDTCLDREDAKGRCRCRRGDAIGRRYEVMYELGAGAFGNVYCAKDHKHDRDVALKIIRNKPAYHRQGLIEAEVLSRLRTLRSPCVVQMLRTFEFAQHKCIVMEMLGINLYQLLRDRGHRGLDSDDPRLKVIARDTATGLRAIRQAGVIHADLKPENIVISPDQNSVKIIDLGSAMLRERARHYTYVQSRYYRSPEAILGIDTGISYAADMWSYGCVLYEMYEGSPLFPGRSEAHMIGLQDAVLGPPPIDLVHSCRKSGHFLTQHGVAVRPRWPYANPAAFFSRRWACAPLADLVMQCLDWLPTGRILPGEALQHPYITPSDP
jgi:serine/threonine protein kinase